LAVLELDSELVSELDSELPDLDPGMVWDGMGWDGMPSWDPLLMYTMLGMYTEKRLKV
jgi:hypothetical protein